MSILSICVPFVSYRSILDTLDRTRCRQRGSFPQTEQETHVRINPVLVRHWFASVGINEAEVWVCALVVDVLVGGPQ